MPFLWAQGKKPKGMHDSSSIHFLRSTGSVECRLWDKAEPSPENQLYAAEHERNLGEGMSCQSNSCLGTHSHTRGHILEGAASLSEVGVGTCVYGSVEAYI